MKAPQALLPGTPPFLRPPAAQTHVSPGSPEARAEPGPLPPGSCRLCDRPSPARRWQADREPSPLPQGSWAVDGCPGPPDGVEDSVSCGGECSAGDVLLGWGGRGPPGGGAHLGGPQPGPHPDLALPVQDCFALRTAEWPGGALVTRGVGAAVAALAEGQPRARSPAKPEEGGGRTGPPSPPRPLARGPPSLLRPESPHGPRDLLYEADALPVPRASPAPSLAHSRCSIGASE